MVQMAGFFILMSLINEESRLMIFKILPPSSFMDFLDFPTLVYSSYTVCTSTPSKLSQKKRHSAFINSGIYSSLSTVIWIVKNCPKNQILSENISWASICPSQVLFCVKNSYFFIIIKLASFGLFYQFANFQGIKFLNNHGQRYQIGLNFYVAWW